MSSQTPTRKSTIPRRSFGVDESALDDNDTPGSISGDINPARRFLGRISFGGSQHRPSFAARWLRTADEESNLESTPMSERPPIPSALQPAGEVYTTPLPTLSMIVLSITMLGEFLSANVSTPFLLFMVKGFGGHTDEADVAFWTGILVSTFFLTQFLTSLLWATVAEKHGQRLVLFVSLLGSALTCLIFGTSTSLQQAIAIRLLQGIFAGAVGVARGSVAFITDGSNEGRAYAILGFCWGFGGVAGAIIGGSFESPAQKWPGTFEKLPFFVTYPYLLPCALAACITFTGSILSLFLARDGGPREGAIRLSPEKLDQHPTIPEEESTPSSPMLDEPPSRGILDSLQRKVPRRLSSYFAQRVHDAHAESSSPRQLSVPLAVPSRRTFSRTSRANGSAYGYTGSFRNRLASTATFGTRRASISSTLRRRRGNNVDGPQGSVPEGGELNFAQRLLMANENAVTNIADLWVAAAMNVDNENPFESDTEVDESDAESLDLGDVLEEEGGNDNDVHGPSMPRTQILSGTSTSASRPMTRKPSGPRPLPPSSRRPSTSQTLSTSVRSPSFGQPPLVDNLDTPSPRRFSSSMPAIFSHSGVRTPPAIVDAQQLLLRTDSIEPTAGGGVGDSLAPIMEHRPLSQAESVFEIEKPPSLSSQLPILVIVQYGMLALHTTTHDQVFMSYLVSKYEAGGLNLNAGHFAQLIALMCLAQIAYQFYLYPNMGPPRGRFSHLAMFRIGSSLFVPAYLTVIPYRTFASPTDDGNFILMSALAISTALRYCGITFAYTAISILLNYMTPPNSVGIANGIAQSIVSLARCFGPVIGGYLWSISVQDDPNGYSLGFLVCTGACISAVASSFIIR